MANNAGWVKLHRSLLDSPIFNDELRLKAWIHLLLKVNHKREKTIINGNFVWVERGQTITSIRQLAFEWKCNRRTVKRILEQLQNEGMIVYEICTSQYTTVTVVKYGFYQDEYTTECTTKCTTECTTECTTDCTQTRMNKNDKNEKNEKKKENMPASAEASHTQKHKYGEYQHVLLSDVEMANLKADFGDNETTEAIRFLDEYIEMKGYKAKSHYLAIRKWVFNAIKERNRRNNGFRAIRKSQEGLCSVITILTIWRRSSWQIRRGNGNQNEEDQRGTI